MAAQYPNYRFTDGLDGGLITQSREVKKVKHRDQTVIVFRHNDFMKLLVYCNEQFARVEVCGAECNYFDGGQKRQGKWIVLKQ